jgi:membrane-associated phospholipid phosphatase
VPTDRTAPTQPAVPATRRTARPPLWLVVVAAVVLIATTADVHFTGALYHFDIDLGRRLHQWDLRHHLAAEIPLRGLVLFGQRAVAVVLAVGFFGWLAWRERISEPLIRLAVALIGIAALVYALKLTVTRLAPIDYFGHHSGVSKRSYPSGHMANAVALWGLALFAAIRWHLPSRAVAAASVLRWVAPAAVAVGMILLDYHWVSDMIAGAAIGVLVLSVAVADGWIGAADWIDARWLRRQSQA